MADKKKYKSVAIPRQLVDQIESEIKHPDSLYTSFAEFVQCGARDLLKIVRDDRLFHEELREKIRSQKLK